jgi:carbonic anhydrase
MEKIMNNKIKVLLKKNKEWAKAMNARDPDFFTKLTNVQNPELLWIGCSDSRVPANEIVGLLPGELFVHRNVANLVVQTDLNCLSVIQYAVDVLKVKDIIVCGHYGCGGVHSAFVNNKLGLIDNWLRNIKDVMEKYGKKLSAIKDEEKRLDKLCELNVIEQVINVAQTTILEDAWDRGQNIAVHGLIYSLKDGMLRDLNVCIRNFSEV